MDFDIDDMLCAGKVPSQDQILPLTFSEKFNLGPIHQLGLATPDVAEAAARLEKAGIGPFLIAEDDLHTWIERGQNKSFHGKLGMAFLGGYELELLEAGKGSTFYSDKFRDDGKIALHHVGILEHHIDENVKRMNDAGIETAVRGRIKLGPLAVNFAYMDSVEQAGLVVEFIDYRLFGRPTKPAEGLIKILTKLLRRLGIKQLRMGKQN